MNRYLPHKSTKPASLETVGADTLPELSAAPSGLGSPDGAISVHRRGIDRKPIQPGWLDEDHRRERMVPVQEHWEARATRLNGQIASRMMGIVDEDPTDTATLKRQRAYAVSRVQRLRADITPRLDACSTEFLPIACGCGLVGATQSCRQWWLCSLCREKRNTPLATDIRRGLKAALDESIAAWGANGGRGMRPEIRLITLTQRHSGNLSEDQQALMRGWRTLYKRMHGDYGKFPYVGVWEVTPGLDKLGHVHLHLAVIWQYRDYKRIRAQWERACPSSMQFDIVRKRRDGRPSTPTSITKYVAKYVSKGVDIGAFGPRLRAEVSAAFYNQHSVLASIGFWKREPKCCAKCECRYRLVEIEKAPYSDRFSGPLEMFLPKARPPPEMLAALR